ncbi:hypothetical protein [Andreprevotia sp. IGB-42]|nr:hypothetical protein [Andreprevotia sp. IGB-42]
MNSRLHDDHHSICIVAACATAAAIERLQLAAEAIIPTGRNDQR